MFVQSWLLFPLVLVLVCLGAGLLLAWLATPALPGLLVLPAGFALLIVVSSVITYLDATAELAAPALAVLAVAGLVAGRRSVRIDERAPELAWAAVAALLPAAAIALPVLLTGHAGFTGYGRIVDGAFQLDYAQYLQHGGHAVPAADSSYLEVIARMLSVDYPAGTQAALGAVSRLAGADPIWSWQPFLAALASVLGLSLFAVLRSPLPAPGPRALAAGIAAQPTILYAYALAAGIKELAAPAFLILAVALLSAHRPGDGGLRQIVPAAVAIAALFAVFNIGVLPWLGIAAAVLFAVEVAGRRARRERVVGGWATLAILAGVLTFPALIASVKLAQVAAAGGPTDLGNLAAPIPAWSAAGVWLTPDHRFPLVVSGTTSPTYVLVAVVLAFAAVGLWRAIGARNWPLVALGAAGIVGLGYVVPRAAPWTDLKAYIMTAPLTLALAFTGAAALLPSPGAWRSSSRSRPARRALSGAGALAAFGLIAGGVLAGNGLEYHGTTLAPTARFADLARIGERYAGQGPALHPSFEEYAEYLLRTTRASTLVDPVGGQTGLRATATPGLQFARDIDEYDLRFLQRYRLLILRHDPTASRPPSDWRLVQRTRYYDVWRRTAGPVIVSHLPLRGRRKERSRRFCGRVATALRAAGPRARMAYAAQPGVIQFTVAPARAPQRWAAAGSDFIARGPGRLSDVLSLPSTATYALWLRGSFGRAIQVSVDGRPVSTVRWDESYPAQYVPVGALRLRAGRHRVEVLRGGGGLLPGTGNDIGSASTLGRVGPLAFAPARGPAAARTARGSRAAAICRSPRALDWIEIVRARR